jgi:UDP-3-O-[3-hydroxymyristoyl] N-acetylglucosamine deacetylase
MMETHFSRVALQNTVTCRGVGLHLGQMTTATLKPAPAGTGRVFIRVDLPGHPEIPADLSQVQETLLSTELGAGSAKVRTVEHLLAVLGVMGVEDLIIEVDGPELPLLDGSGLVWWQALQSGGLTPRENRAEVPPLTEPVAVYDGDAFVIAIPAPQRRFTYGIDFPRYAPIGKHWYSWHPEAEPFATEVAPARTFGFADQVEKLRQAGLIQGGSLENALVCDGEIWLNPPLRFADEPARHKLLDLLGDLSLLGPIPQAHYLAYKASHKLHIQLARRLLGIN